MLLNCNIVDTSKINCIDSSGVPVKIPDEIIIYDDHVILVEKASVANIGKVRQLVEAWEALKRNPCVNLESILRGKSIIAGIVHGNSVWWDSRCAR